MSNQREKVLKSRYLMEGEKTASDMFHRVANHLADTPTEAGMFFEIMNKLQFLPNTPCLVNAGNPKSSGQLMACFVLPIKDSMDGIFTTLHDAAMIHKTGGGTGFNFGGLRPSDSPVSSTLGVASGPISFMKAYDAATETVKQGGVRRGANMGIMPVSHPDILNFIKCKTNNDTLNNFNLSVALSEKFMNALEKDKPWNFEFDGKKINSGLRAKEIFDMLVEQAWLNGEPGIIFMDEVNKKHPLLEEIAATNPCGEQPLLPYEACCLGSVNLSAMVKEPKEKPAYFDMEMFRRVIHIAVRMLDNTLNKNVYPMPEIKETCLKNRKIGLGIMGYADMLIKLGLRYGTDEANSVTKTIAGYYASFAEEASQILAQERGCFPNWDNSTWGTENVRMRNATVTTIAPTGTISIIAGVSNGIEPIFAPVTVLNRMDTTFVEVHPLVEVMLKRANKYEKFMQDSNPDIIKYLPHLKRLLVTAHEISPHQHIVVQSLWQQYTHNAVSKTINMSNNVLQDDVARAFLDAYELGCKGITIYRDGSRQGQVFSKKEEKPIGMLNPNGLGEKPVFEATTGNMFEPRERPEITNGFTVKQRIGCGNLYITVNHDEEGTCEIFTNTGKAGGCTSQSEATARMASIAMRCGIPTEAIIDQLKGIRCGSCTRNKDVHVLSCPDAIAHALMIAEGIGTPPEDSVFLEEIMKEAVKEAEPVLLKLCPECGAPLEHEGGCVTCRSCGYSKCG